MYMRETLKRFYKHRRGWYSFVLLVLLLVLVLFTPLLCKKRPYIIWTPQKIYLPFVYAYTDADLGGTLPVVADYTEEEVQTFVTQQGGWMLWPPLRYNPDTVDHTVSSPAPPSFKHWLGTDGHGRDVLVRLLYGWRTSLFFGISLTLISLFFGITLGAIQGYWGGIVDLIGQRFIDLWSSFPKLFVVLVVSSFVHPHLMWLLMLLSLFSWMGLASKVRVEFLRVRSYDYVLAAHALGVPSLRLMWRHVLPNALVAAVTYLPFLLNGGIASLTALDFLGFGLPVGTPSLGDLLSQARHNLYAPWLTMTAFGGTAFVLILIAFIGEGLRDALDSHVYNI